MFIKKTTKMNKIIIGLVIITMSSFSNSQKSKMSCQNVDCPFKLGTPNEIKLGGKGFGHPKISPDGTKLLLTKNYDGIYLAEINNPKNIRVISTGKMDGFNMRWGNQDNTIQFERSTKVDSKKFERQLFITNYHLKSSSKVDISDFKSPIDFLKNKNDLLIQNDFQNKKLIANNGEKVWDITPEIGICLDIVLSPDKTKVVFTCHGREYVYAIDGSGLITQLNAGLNKSWSRDGEYILYFKAEEKRENYITNSDLYLCRSDGSAYWKLTDTPDILEIRPHWSAGGDKIVYVDAKTNKIFIADLIKAKTKTK